MPIDRIHIQNFKSIKDQVVKLAPINVLIGSNGVGKSNFISFFSLVKNIYEQRLNTYIKTHGKADSFLHFGRKYSDYVAGELYFRRGDYVSNAYKFNLVPDQEDALILAAEESNYNPNTSFNSEEWNRSRYSISSESYIKNSSSFRDKHLRNYFEQFNVFHFHDTSRNSKLKQSNRIKDNRSLNSDGSNLAAFLYLLQEQHPAHFKMIEKTVASIAPFFEKFDLEEDKQDPEYIDLKWLENGSDLYFNAHNLSDGTLRFIALTTLLLQPKPPNTIIIDEPELGLHPFAIKKLAAMVKAASDKSQIILSTQSVTLLNEFEPEDIIVAERKDGKEGRQETIFKRPDEENLVKWLEDYTIGELWEKNVLGGRPR